MVFVLNPARGTGGLRRRDFLSLITMLMIIMIMMEMVMMVLSMMMSEMTKTPNLTIVTLTQGSQ